MEEKTETKEQTKMIQKIERSIKKMEALDKKSQQPWRKSGKTATVQIHDTIYRLNDLLLEVRCGGSSNYKVNTLIRIADSISTSMAVELEYQDMQKSQDKEITPFGKMNI